MIILQLQSKNVDICWLTCQLIFVKHLDSLHRFVVDINQLMVNFTSKSLWLTTRWTAHPAHPVHPVHPVCLHCKCPLERFPGAWAKVDGRVAFWYKFWLQNMMKSMHPQNCCRWHDSSGSGTLVSNLEVYSPIMAAYTNLIRNLATSCGKVFPSFLSYF